MPLITSSRVLLLSVLVFSSILHLTRSQLDLDDFISLRGSFSAEDGQEATLNSSTTAASIGSASAAALMSSASTASNENETTTPSEPPPILSAAIDGPNVRKLCPPGKALSDNKCETILQFDDEK